MAKKTEIMNYKQMLEELENQNLYLPCIIHKNRFQMD